MNKSIIPILSFVFILSCSVSQTKQVETKIGHFNPAKDLLLAHFDCKTDVDDIHTAAALKMLMSNPAFSKIDYHVVAGTYGVQEGLYVPANDFFQESFKNSWSDAHTNRKKALDEVFMKAKAIFEKGGNIWIAEGGQSDFSAGLVRKVLEELPEIPTLERINIVQHSDWNEEVTSEESLVFVKEHTAYHKIPDGNAVGNGSPGFRTSGYKDWKNQELDAEQMKIWQMAVEIGNSYNGKEGRYNNEAVASGGLDFSDLSETCWILGIEDILDTKEFFERFSQDIVQ